MLEKTGTEVHLMHEFLPLELFLVFSNEHAQSTTLGPKLMFSKVSRHFVDAPDPLQKLVSACIWLSVVFFRTVGLSTYYLKDFNALL